MTDKEFRRLKRSQLIEIIYELQLEQQKLIEEKEEIKQNLTREKEEIEQKLIEEKEELQRQIDNWQSKIEKGSIAEATVAVSNIFEEAQKTADQYLKEIYSVNAANKKKCDEMLEEAERKSEEIRRQTERYIQSQWEEFQGKVTEVLKTHTQLEVFLNAHQK